MRQQYHSRKTLKGRYVWDVRKLVALARDLPVKDIPLIEIRELDENYWYDPADNGPPPMARAIADHAKLIYECDLSYPIILDPLGRIMDGMHRCCKAYLMGHETIKAVQFETEPDPHYINPDWKNLP